MRVPRTNAMSNYLKVFSASAANRSGGGSGSDVDSTASASISIPEAVSEDGVTYYAVRVDVDAVNWTVRRRFRDFAEVRAGKTDLRFLVEKSEHVFSHLRNMGLFMYNLSSCTRSSSTRRSGSPRTRCRRSGASATEIPPSSCNEGDAAMYDACRKGVG